MLYVSSPVCMQMSAHYWCVDVISWSCLWEKSGMGYIVERLNGDLVPTADVLESSVSELRFEWGGGSYYFHSTAHKVVIWGNFLCGSQSQKQGFLLETSWDKHECFLYKGSSILLSGLRLLAMLTKTDVSMGWGVTAEGGLGCDKWSAGRRQWIN